jgi:hypothetical protein
MKIDEKPEKLLESAQAEKDDKEEPQHRPLLGHSDLFSFWHICLRQI